MVHAAINMTTPSESRTCSSKVSYSDFRGILYSDFNTTYYVVHSQSATRSNSTNSITYTCHLLDDSQEMTVHKVCTMTANKYTHSPHTKFVPLKAVTPDTPVPRQTTEVPLVKILVSSSAKHCFAPHRR